MCASSQQLASELREPPFDEIHPAAAGGREVKRVSRVAQQPLVDGGCLVCRGVVEHDRAVLGAGLLDDLAETHRQERLRPIQRLDAGLLVDAQDPGVFWRIHVEPDNVADLLDEHRIFRKFERVSQPGFEPERFPDSTDRRG